MNSIWNLIWIISISKWNSVTTYFQERKKFSVMQIIIYYPSLRNEKKTNSCKKNMILERVNDSGQEEWIFRWQLLVVGTPWRSDKASTREPMRQLSSHARRAKCTVRPACRRTFAWRIALRSRELRSRIPQPSHIPDRQINDADRQGPRPLMALYYASRDEIKGGSSHKIAPFAALRSH